MIVCFVIVLEIMGYQSLFSDKHLSLCQATIPALYIPFNSTLLRNPATQKSPFPPSLFTNVRPTRPPAALTTAYDARCNALLPDSHYGIYALDGNFNQPYGNYSFHACR